MSDAIPSLSHLESHCLFCDPEGHGQEAQILLRSDSFYLFAGLGPILEHVHHIVGENPVKIKSDQPNPPYPFLYF